MKDRLAFLGWFVLWVAAITFIVVIGMVLFPIWVIVWVLTGKFYPQLAIGWTEDWFPPEATS